MLDDYIVEVDETDRRRVVLVISALRLIVIGATLDEARVRAAAALKFRTQSTQLPSAPEDGSRRCADTQAAPGGSRHAEAQAA